MSLREDAQINLTADEEVGTIAVVLVWHTATGQWVNSGLVVNELNPITCFQKALAKAIEAGLWEA